MPLNIQAAMAVASEGVDDWPAPTPIPAGLLPVKRFDLSLIPPPLAPWVADIAERMQVPPEFVAVPAMIAAGAVIGRKIGIRPQAETDWHEAVNLWGMIIGRPGVIKSPSVQNAMRPINRLQAEARRDFMQRNVEYEASALERELRGDARKRELKKRFKLNPKADTSDLAGEDEPEPTLKRYIANDTTYQSLGELLIENENGILVYRDELMSLLQSLDREENIEARGFYLSAWNGTADYTFDRVIRGKNLYIPSLTVSMIGSTQPSKIRSYLSSAMKGGTSDDGLIQRFGLMVWPDIAPDYVEQDRAIDAAAQRAAYDVFERLAKITPPSVGAHPDPADERSSYLRFDRDGLALFQDWRKELESRVRSGELHGMIESHLAKYRGLIPALALIHHLASGGRGPVSELPTLAALAWAEYLETHANRIYSAALNNSADGAREIIRRLKRGDLPDRFVAREVVRKSWSGLTSTAAVEDALGLLEDHHWVRAVDVPTGLRGGRPTVAYVANPKGYER